MFVVKQEVHDFCSQLLDAKFIHGVDETELMLKERAFDKKQLEDLQNIHNLKASKDEQYKFFMDTLSKEPENKQLAEYRKRNSQKEITHLSLYFMSLPSNKKCTFGSFTYVPFFIEKFHGLVASVFYQAKIKEWIFLGYAHTSNEGHAMLIKPIEDDFDITDFVIKKSEREKFEKYAERVEKKINYPIMEVHNYLSNNGHYPIPWQYQITFPLIKKEK